MIYSVWKLALNGRGEGQSIMGRAVFLEKTCGNSKTMLVPVITANNFDNPVDIRKRFLPLEKNYQRMNWGLHLTHSKQDVPGSIMKIWHGVESQWSKHYADTMCNVYDRNCKWIWLSEADAAQWMPTFPRHTFSELQPREKLWPMGSEWKLFVQLPRYILKVKALMLPFLLPAGRISGNTVN